MTRKILFALSMILLAGCLRKTPETPDTLANTDPNLSVNTSAAMLWALLPPEGQPLKIDDDKVLACQVRANDKSGNLHNCIYVEDSTGGLCVLLNDDNLYNRFVQGRKIYLHLKNCYLGNYHGNLQIGGAPAADNSGVLQVSDIPAKNIPALVTWAPMTAEKAPIKTSLFELKKVPSALINCLVQIDDVQFKDPAGNVFSNPTAATSVLIADCSDSSMELRTSNYANFSAAALPLGKGSIVGIFTVYNGKPQLTLRDTSDLSMNGTRCNGTVITPPSLVRLETLRTWYKDKDTVLPNVKIRAVVTADGQYKNFGTGNIVVQDGDKGMTVYFGSSAADLPLVNDSVEITLTGATLTKYNDAQELKNLSVNDVRVLRNNVTVVPKTLTIAQLNASFANYESVLVKIENARVAAGGKYSGSKTLSDGTGSILLYTSSSATFANDNMPSITKTFQGIATPYGSTPEIKIRNPATDVY